MTRLTSHVSRLTGPFLPATHRFQAPHPPVALSPIHRYLGRGDPEQSMDRHTKETERLQEPLGLRGDDPDPRPVATVGSVLKERERERERGTNGEGHQVSEQSAWRDDTPTTATAAETRTTTQATTQATTRTATHQVHENGEQNGGRQVRRQQRLGDLHTAPDGNGRRRRRSRDVLPWCPSFQPEVPPAHAPPGGGWVLGQQPPPRRGPRGSGRSQRRALYGDSGECHRHRPYR